LEESMDPSWDGLLDEVIHSLVLEEYEHGGNKLLRSIANNTPVYTLQNIWIFISNIVSISNLARYYSLPKFYSALSFLDINLSTVCKNPIVNVRLKSSV
jgi:hypothetical protein